MSAQNGRDMLVKLKTPENVYETVVGLRTKTLRFNSKTVDVTDNDSAQGWKELLPQAGMKFAEISGSGLFKTGANAALIRQAFFDQDLLDLRFILPGFGQIDGPFLIGSLSYSGQYQGEASFEIVFLSAGLPVFSAL